MEDSCSTEEDESHETLKRTFSSYLLLAEQSSNQELLHVRNIRFSQISSDSSENADPSISLLFVVVPHMREDVCGEV